MFRRIKRLKSNKGSSATAFVNVTQPDGSVKSVSKKEDLEKVIIDSNIKKYHQCENTPFFQEPLLSHFGRFGEGPCTTQVADGTYHIPEHLDEVTKDFLQICQQSDQVK